MENSNQNSQAVLDAKKEKIIKACNDFGVEINSIEVVDGPNFEVKLKTPLEIDRIRDLEMLFTESLNESRVSIKNPKEVSLQSILTSDEFQDCSFDLPIILGKTVENENVIVDLSNLPHLLVGGATYQGKTVFLHSIINSLLHKKRPEELKLVLIDGENKQFSIYADLKNNYLAKQSNGVSQVISDSKMVVDTLNSLNQEMENRYEVLKQNNVHNLKELKQLGKDQLPYFVVIIDDFFYLLLMMIGRRIEPAINNLSMRGGAVGIHLVIATTPKGDYSLSIYNKANFPAKVAFRVTSKIDSRTILDAPGAEQLLGRGDMLFSQGDELVRIQSAFIDTPEIEQFVKSISEQVALTDTFILPTITDNQEFLQIEKSDLDPFYDEALKWAKQKKEVSINQIQRKFAVGHNRAVRIFEQLKVNGIVK